jgi:hypothetical protein
VHTVLYSSFSDDVLSTSPQRLAVLSGAGLGWNDLGEPARIFSVLSRKGQNAFRRNRGLRGSVAIQHFFGKSSETLQVSSRPFAASSQAWAHFAHYRANHIH